MGGHYFEEIEGLSSEAKQLFELCRKADGTRSRQLSSLKGMFEILGDMEPILVELYYDLRLIAGLITFPVGQRMEIKDKLIRKALLTLQTTLRQLRSICCPRLHGQKTL